MTGTSYAVYWDERHYEDNLQPWVYRATVLWLYKGVVLDDRLRKQWTARFRKPGARIRMISYWLAVTQYTSIYRYRANMYETRED